MKSRRGMIPATIERCGEEKNEHYHKDKCLTFGLFSLKQLFCNSIRIQYKDHGRCTEASPESVQGNFCEVQNKLLAKVTNRWLLQS